MKRKKNTRVLIQRRLIYCYRTSREAMLATGIRGHFASIPLSFIEARAYGDRQSGQRFGLRLSRYYLQSGHISSGCSIFTLYAW